jgi:hypothetical protein
VYLLILLKEIAKKEELCEKLASVVFQITDDAVQGLRNLELRGFEVPVQKVINIIESNSKHLC